MIQLYCSLLKIVHKFKRLGTMINASCKESIVKKKVEHFKCSHELNVFLLILTHPFFFFFFLSRLLSRIITIAIDDEPKNKKPQVRFASYIGN